MFWCSRQKNSYLHVCQIPSGWIEELLQGKDWKKLRNGRRSDIDWATVLLFVFMTSQSVTRNISDQLENKRAIYLITLALSKNSYSRLINNEILFLLDNPMMLRDIVSAWYSDILYKVKVDIRTGQNCVKLTTPIPIVPHKVYAINFQSKITDVPYTRKSIVNTSVVELAPNVNISFLGDADRSLITVLYFTHLSRKFIHTIYN